MTNQDRENLEACIASGQVSAAQLVQHVTADEYVGEVRPKTFKPQLGVWYNAGERNFRDHQNCTMPPAFYMAYRDRAELFPQTREAALRLAYPYTKDEGD